MKKGILILVLVALVATGAFAQMFSFGGGALFDASFLNGVYLRGFGERFYIGEQILAPGIFMFFDAMFVEAELGVTYGMHTLVTNITEAGKVETESFGAALALGFSVLGKYPFAVSSNIALFPLLGASYNLVLLGITGELSESDANVVELSQFGLLAGLGADFNLTESIFFRAEAMFHFRFPSKFWRDIGRDFDYEEGIRADNTFGMGPRVKVGIGYRF